MNITPETLELSMLNQLAQGKAPHPEYYEKLGVSQREIQDAVKDMRENRYIDDNGAGGGAGEPSEVLDRAKITVAGQNYLSKHYEITAAYRDLKD
jgi:predicted transcriptional regulator